MPFKQWSTVFPGAACVPALIDRFVQHCKQSSTVFPGAACVSALIDRFVQHCHILDIDADSWRQKESLAISEARSKPRAEATEPPAPAKRR